MKKNVKFLALAGILTALSIALDVIVKQFIPVLNFGLPYYAIPLIIGGILLGPVYGLLMGFVSDFIGFQLAPNGDYIFLFALSAMAWGALPGLLLKSKSRLERIVIVLLITHLFATAANTGAMFLYGWGAYAMANLPLRLLMLPVNVSILSFITFYLNHRLQPVYEDFLVSK
ncbi:folate family ECF transporter S component [Acholeplasma vituli]|uniref:Folate family ECF transporter S component n=1 Tax=Paracholeplasma vituli TaxID=69473 RepID=A0ABT2PXW1_9MOLU|nr:folate family ECF transporter S component [Paracholeplasma vituli]MCU0105695.1 folate family ECF transporter S component [Paracholeplasma vituli]